MDRMFATRLLMDALESKSHRDVYSLIDYIAGSEKRAEAVRTPAATLVARSATTPGSPGVKQDAPGDTTEAYVDVWAKVGTEKLFVGALVALTRERVARLADCVTKDDVVGVVRAVTGPRAQIRVLGPAFVRLDTLTWAGAGDDVWLSEKRAGIGSENMPATPGLSIVRVGTRIGQVRNGLVEVFIRPRSEGGGIFGNLQVNSLGVGIEPTGEAGDIIAGTPVDNQMWWDASARALVIADSVRISNTDGATRIDAIDGENDNLNLRGRGTGLVNFNYNAGTGGTKWYDGSTNNVASIDALGKGWLKVSLALGDAMVPPDVDGKLYCKDIECTGNAAVAMPTADGHATPRLYVDNAIGGGTADPWFNSIRVGAAARLNLWQNAGGDAEIANVGAGQNLILDSVQHIAARLGDAAGAHAFYIQDSSDVTKWQCDSNGVVMQVGNLGIGAVPTQKLDVRGAAVFLGSRLAIGDGATMPFVNTGTPGLWLSAGGVVGTSQFLGQYATDTVGIWNQAWAVLIDAVGSVYFGTTPGGARFAFDYPTGNLKLTGDLRVDGGDIGITSLPALIQMADAIDAVTVTRSANSALNLAVTNTNAGAAASAGIKVTSDGGSSYIYRTSNAYSAGAAAFQDDTIIQDGGGGDVVIFGAAAIARFANAGIVTLANDLRVDGGDIGLTADPDLMQLAANLLTVNGNIIATKIGLGVSPLFPLHAKRTGCTTNVAWSAGRFVSKKTSNMGDGFGTGFSLAIEDDEGVENDIIGIWGLRHEADNSGKLVLQVCSGGVGQDVTIDKTRMVTAARYTSDIATGTQPYTCTSVTKNTNLHADYVDTLHFEKWLHTITADDIAAGYYLEAWVKDPAKIIWVDGAFWDKGTPDIIYQLSGGYPSAIYYRYGVGYNNFIVNRGSLVWAVGDVGIVIAAYID